MTPPSSARVSSCRSARARSPASSSIARRRAGPRSPRPDIKPIRQVLDAEAFLPADVVALARWTAEYYAAGPGDTITAVLPPKTRGDRADAHKTVRVAAITAAGLASARLKSRTAVTPKQREALDILAGAPGGVPTAELAARGIGADTVSRLARHGFVSLRQDRVDRDPFERRRFAATLADGRIGA